MIETEAPEFCELLAFDTGFFGFPIARVRADTLTDDIAQQIDAWCHRIGVRCLYFLSRADEQFTTRVAECCGYQLMDVRLTLTCQLETLPNREVAVSSAVRIRPVQSAEITALEQIARVSHTDTRFFFDPNFSRGRCEELYATWIRRSCAGYAQQVLVALVDGAPAGYISCHLDVAAQLGTIGLIAVADGAQGRGVGQALVAKALTWFARDAAMVQVQVVTQARNIAAQRLYQRCGFMTHTVGLWYHKWYV